MDYTNTELWIFICFHIMHILIFSPAFLYLLLSSCSHLSVFIFLYNFLHILVSINDHLSHCCFLVFTSNYSDIYLSHGQFDDHSYLGSNSVTNFFHLPTFISCEKLPPSQIHSHFASWKRSESIQYFVMDQKCRWLLWIWRDFYFKVFQEGLITEFRHYN